MKTMTGYDKKVVRELFISTVECWKNDLSKGLSGLRKPKTNLR